MVCQSEISNLSIYNRAMSELPHTRGCIVCGKENPHGLRAHLNVDERTGTVTCEFVCRPEHIGFEGMIHGGVLATLLDEAMVWAATWAGRRFCVCGELNVRFRQPVLVGQRLRVEARVVSNRTRLIETEASVRDEAGKLLVGAEGKYVPVAAERNREFVATLVAEPTTERTLRELREGDGGIEVP